MRRFNFLEKLYISLAIIFILLAGFTPLLVQDGFYFLTEEVIEVILIFFLFGLGSVIIFLFKREAEKSRRLAEATTENLTEVFKHVGKINIYTKEMNSIISGVKCYPKTQKEFKQILRLMAEKTLSFIEVDYIWLKIINKDKVNIVTEMFVARGDKNISSPAISNRALLDNNMPENFSSFVADAENISTRVFAVMPAIAFDDEQKNMIKAVLNQVQMIFLIFSLGCNKDDFGKSASK